MAATKDIAWSKKTYSLSELLDQCTLPAIIQVTRGYYGQDDIETLASNQVARVHMFGSQKRVLARDARGRYLSIPADYPIKFEVLDKKGKRTKARTLKDILNLYTFPVFVIFERKTKWHFRIGSSKYTTGNFGRIELIRLYEEQFIKGNTIHEGVIDDKVMLVPTYVNIQVRVATGLRHGSTEDWPALVAMYSRAVSHIHFDKITGIRDIMLYPFRRPVGDNDKMLAVGFGGGVESSDKERNNKTNQDTNNNTSFPNKVSPGSGGGGGGKGGSGHSAVTRTGSNSPRDMLDDGSGIIKLKPNWTLVLNINKDDLSLQRSLSPATGSGIIPSSMTGSLDHHLDNLDGYSDASSLSGESVTRSVSTVQNVVRVSLGDDDGMPYMRSHRSSRANSISNVKRSRKPHPDRRYITRPRRPRSVGPGDGLEGDASHRAASLENFPDDIRYTGNITKAQTYYDDMDIVVPVRMDGMEMYARPRRYESIRRKSSNRGGVARYGTRLKHGPYEATSYGALRQHPISRSAHDLRQTEVLEQIPYEDHLPRHRSLERINAYLDEPDEPYGNYDDGGLRNIYQTDELWMGVTNDRYGRNPDINRHYTRNSYTLPYTRKAELEQAPQPKFADVDITTATFPRTRTNDFRYVPIERESTHIQSLPHGSLHMSIGNLPKQRRPLVITRTAAPPPQRLQSSSSHDIFYQTSPSYRPPPTYRNLYGNPYLHSLSYGGLSSSSTSNYKTSDTLRTAPVTSTENGITSSDTTVSSLTPPSGEILYSGTMTLRRDHEGAGGTQAIRSSNYPVSPGSSELDLNSPPLQTSSMQGFNSYEVGPEVTSLTVQNVPIEYENGLPEPTGPTVNVTSEGSPPPPLISANGVKDGFNEITTSTSAPAKTTEPLVITSSSQNGTELVNGDTAIYATVNKLNKAQKKIEDIKGLDSDASSNQADPPSPPPPLKDTGSSGTTSRTVYTTTSTTYNAGNKDISSNQMQFTNHITNHVTSHMTSSSSKQTNVVPSGGQSNKSKDSTDGDDKGGLERSGSVRSLREVYSRYGKTPPSSLRLKQGLSVAPASEIFSDALNQPSTSTGGTTGSGKVVMNGGYDLAWQETSSYPMDSINDSLKELDAILKKEDPDSVSQSSHTSSKHLEHFNFTMGEETTAL